MNAQQDRAVIGWFNARPAAKKVLWAVSIGAVAAVYLLYLGLLAWLAWHAMWAQLGVTVVVPAAAFVVGTALRAAIDATGYTAGEISTAVYEKKGFFHFGKKKP